MTNLTINLPEKVYKCKNGHKWFVKGEPFTVSVLGDEEYTSGPICPYCYVDLHREMCGGEEDV